MRTTRWTALTATAAVLGAAALTSAVAPQAAADPLPPPATHDDFNGDGYPDLVTAAPSATVDGRAGAGYVVVLYGGEAGLSTAHRTVISQATAGVPGAPEAGDAFGQAAASGDLDGDGFPDLVVGAPGEDQGTVRDAGGAVVLWGSAKGLTGTSTGLNANPPVEGDRYGLGLAVGDYWGGERNMAAVQGDGAPSFVSFTADRQPSVQTPPARAQGRAASAADSVTETGLVSGDFNRDHIDDLVQLGTLTTPEGVEPFGFYIQGTDQGPIFGAEFRGGTVGAVGDVNGDGYDDLVTGHPEQGQGNARFWPGSQYGFGGEHVEFTQDTPGVPDTGENGDRWGSDLSIGDVDGDGHADVAVGGDGEDVGTVRDAGAVWLLRGSADGPTATGAQMLHQDSADVPGAVEASDRFGGQVRIIDAGRDGTAGLVAAAPGENGSDGVVWVLPGTASGLTASGSWTFGGGSVGAPYDGARFGATIAE
ncbi:FG-GAP repeat protein [Streptomyces capparidis]